jgi:restriction endonuclease S subunit
MLFKAHELATAMCPAGWTRVRLAEIAQEVSVRAGHDTALPVLSVTKHRGIVKAEDYFSKAVHGRDTSNYKIVRSGDFAYATIHLDEGSLGRHTDTPSGIVSPMYTVFEVTAGFDPYYLETLLRSPKSIVTYGSLGQGTVNRRASISFSAFSGLVLQHPPLPEQKKIAAILSSVDEVIAKTEAVIAQLQIVKKAMMEQLLTKGMPGRHTRFKQTEIGEIPEEWEVVELGSVGEWLSGGTPSKSDPHLWAGSVPWVSPKDMKRPRLGDAEDHVHEDAIGNGTRLVPADTLLMVVRGMILAHTFPVCLTTASVTFNQDIKALRPSVHFEPEFLLYWLQGSQSRVLEITEVANHGTKRIPTEQLHAMGVPLPSLPEQQGIVHAIRSLEVLIGKTTDEKRELQAVKSSLSSSLLSGEIRVIPEVA